jgi:Transcription factor homologous to NACalpha-BTF3
MVDFEKVEKLVQKANVSYEDAKNALEAANGDMLDAIIALEKEGKVKSQTSSYSSTTSADASPYRDVPAVVDETNKTEGKSFFKDLGAAIKRGFKYTVDNSVRVVRNDVEIIKLPLWISIIAMLCAWELLLIVIIVSLFFDCRYSVVGKDNANEFNKVVDQASVFAGKVKESWNESFNNNAEASVETASNEAAAESTVEGPVEGTVEDTPEN